MTEPQSTTDNKMVPLGGRAQLVAAAARLNQAHAVTAERFPALAAARAHRNSQTVSEMADDMDLQDSDYRFLVGWLIASSPEATADALDALHRFRDVRAEQ